MCRFKLNIISINNPNAATIGTNYQTDASLEALRKSTLSNLAIGTLDSIASALYLVSGVQSLKGQENIEASVLTIDTIKMKANSIYFCVNGGLDTDVARAIYKHRSAGSGFNGNTSVPITSSAGQIINVLFDRPTVVSILVTITVTLTSSTTGNDIANLIGEFGSTVKIKQDVSPFEIAGTVSDLNGVYVQNCTIALATVGTFSNSPIVININEIGSINASAVSVVVA
jgi:hypothetical protein